MSAFAAHNAGHYPNDASGDESGSHCAKRRRDGNRYRFGAG